MKQLYVADDNQEFAEFVATVARREKWSTEICSNGRELLERLEAGSGPALLLVDINMPEMDGIEVVEGFVDIDRPLSIRFMTGGPDSSIVAAAMIANARSLTVGKNIFKPLERDALLKILDQEAENFTVL